MHSIKAKTTFLTLFGIITSIIITAALATVSIKNLGNEDARQLLLLMCETGQKNLDTYFKDAEHSVNMVARLVEEDITDLDDDNLTSHMERARDIFATASNQTKGILTYYYRIDPEISDSVKGFWYTNLDGLGFKEHEVTDITAYDTTDTSSLVWFTVPKTTGKSVWLPPYITENLDTRVLSYNKPVYWKGEFVGVVGMEIDYSTMAQQVDNIQLYENGYAFLNDEEGNIIYHPYIDVATLTDDNIPKAPKGLLSDQTFTNYTFNGIEKLAVWKPLSNGMRLTVTVPTKEINRSWQKLITDILLVSGALVIVFTLLALHFSGHITKPLQKLTKVAEQINVGNYNYELDVKGNDEVALLSSTFNKVGKHLRRHFEELNSLVYVDALTSVRNKAAYDLYVKDLQKALYSSGESIEFAVVLFDCDGLKKINDQYGHDKGDLYLQNACHQICIIFEHSPVFRTGGDEFVSFLLKQDFDNRKTLIRSFRKACSKSRELAKAPWEEVNISLGLAVYDPENDGSVRDVVRRADKLMYADKWRHKNGI